MQDSGEIANNNMVELQIMHSAVTKGQDRSSDDLNMEETSKEESEKSARVGEGSIAATSN